MLCLGCKVDEVYLSGYDGLHKNKKETKGYCIACCPCERHEENRNRVIARRFTKSVSQRVAEGIERPPQRRMLHMVTHLLPGEQVVELYSLFKRLEKSEARGYG